MHPPVFVGVWAAKFIETTTVCINYCYSKDGRWDNTPSTSSLKVGNASFKTVTNGYNNDLIYPKESGFW